MSPTPTLNGQDVGEAEGALTSLLERILVESNAGLSRVAYITLRVLALRGPAQSPAAFVDYLASQRQLGLDRSQAAELLRGLERNGLISGSGDAESGPIQLTENGVALHARLADAVMTVTRRLYSDLDPDDLATAHNVLVEVTQRATRLRDEL